MAGEHLDVLRHDHLQSLLWLLLQPFQVIKAERLKLLSVALHPKMLKRGAYSGVPTQR